MKQRFHVRKFLNPLDERLTASLMGLIEDNEEHFHAEIEIRDCGRGVTLDFDLPMWEDDDDLFYETRENNLRKARILKEEFRRFSATLRRAYARASKLRKKRLAAERAKGKGE